MIEHKDDIEVLKDKTIPHSDVSRIMLSDREGDFKEVIKEMKRRGRDLDNKNKKELGE